MEKRGKFIAWTNAETLEDTETILNIRIWKYAEDIKPENPQKQELLTKANELIQKAGELKAAANKLYYSYFMSDQADSWKGYLPNTR